jgi:hypothetical protein
MGGGGGGREASGKEMDLASRSSFISSKDFRQRVDLGDLIAGPFPEKQSPPSEIILSQQGGIIKDIVRWLRRKSRMGGIGRT